MFIKGVGMTKFGTDLEQGSHMAYEAAMEAIDDSQMPFEKIDAIIMSCMESPSNGERQKHTASMLSSLFQKKCPILNIPAGCAGGGSALWTSVKILKNQANNYDNILVLCVDKIMANTSKNVTDEILMGGERIYEQTEGLNFPAQNALCAQQYMRKYGATMDDLSLVAFKNHSNAYLNPKAKFYKKKVTLEEIKSSPVVASPLRLFDCSISCNGAAAVIISKEKSDIEITGSSEEGDFLSPFERDDMTSLESTRKAAKSAYEEAGIGPKDLELVELHDAFTPLELISYEDLGLCKKGEGAKLIRGGTTNLNGSLPVNTSGGLKARGHPISPTGISQVYELVKQMRKQAGDRQVKVPKYSLVHNIGGVGSVATVHILKNLN